MADSWHTLGTTMATLYWSFYGLESQSNADVVLPNSVVKRRTNETVHVDPEGHHMTEVAGHVIYGVYFFCGPMILINLLIAIMSASFHSVTENSDTEWKFARVQVCRQRWRQLCKTNVLHSSASCNYYYYYYYYYYYCCCCCCC